VRRAVTRAAALAALLLLAACRYEADLTVHSDGSGAGAVRILDPPPLSTPEDVRRQLERAGFIVESIAAASPQRIDARVSWKDFDLVFLRRTLNADGSVTLDFGPIDQGSLTVRVPGRIDPGDTTGPVHGSIAAFGHGRARLTYVPASAGPWIALAAGAALLLALVLAAWFYSRRPHRDPGTPAPPR
jgi:hypothetical protein